MAAVEIRNLHRRFGKVHAVQDLSFTLSAGKVTGFIGSNGSGKTTTLRMIATLDQPDAGSITILGHDAIEDPAAVRSRIGWVPDLFLPEPHLTVLEYLDFHARALGFKGGDRLQRVAEIAEFTGLDQIHDRPANKLSKGQTQRLCLGRALIHDPDILLLDEPAAGLDPRARVELKNLIALLREEGKTVFISSHILSELGEMCDELVFIHDGRLLHQGRSDELRRTSAGPARVEIRVAGRSAELEAWCQLQPNVRYLEPLRDGALLEMEDATPANHALLLKRLVGADFPVHEYRHRERNLEDAFIDIVTAEESRRRGEFPDTPRPAPPSSTPSGSTAKPPPLPQH